MSSLPCALTHSASQGSLAGLTPTINLARAKALASFAPSWKPWSSLPAGTKVWCRGDVPTRAAVQSSTTEKLVTISTGVGAESRVAPTSALSQRWRVSLSTKGQ